MISYINRFLEKHGALTYTFLFLAMVFPLIMLYGVDWQSLFSGPRGDPGLLGTINGRELRRAELTSKASALLIEQYLDFGGFQRQEFERFRGFALGNPYFRSAFEDRAIRRILLLAEARNMGLEHVSKEEIRAYIRSRNVFLKDDDDKSFNQAAFDTFKEQLLRLERLTAEDFDNVIRDTIVIQRLEDRIQNGTTVSEAEAKARFLIEYSTAGAKVARFNSAIYKRKINIDEEALAEFFERNRKQKYLILERKKFAVAVFSQRNYKKKNEVTEEEIAKKYEEDKERYYAKPKDDPSPWEVRCRLILVRFGPRARKEEKAKKRETAEAIISQIADGTDFAELAVAKSDDTKSASQGGDIGFFRRSRRWNIVTEGIVANAFSLKDGEVSGVIENEHGFNIIQRVEARDEVPLDEVRTRIHNNILRSNQRLQDDKAATAKYEELKATKYTVDEVKARHILIRFNPDADDDAKAAALEKAQDVLARLDKGEDFAELARSESKDPSSAAKGGDLGFFGRNDMVPPFDRAVFALADGDVSKPIKTKFGYHIIQRLEHRTEIPYSDVRLDLKRDIRQKRQGLSYTLATTAATEFNIAVMRALRGREDIDQPMEFLAFCDGYNGTFKVDGIKYDIIFTLEHTQFLDENNRNVRNLPGNTTDLLSRLLLLSDINPLSKPPIEDVNKAHLYVACWQETKPPKLHDLKDVRAQVKADATDELALKQARDAARLAYESLSERLADGSALGKITNDDDPKFRVVGNFRIAEAPKVRNDADDIQKIVSETPALTLAAPVDTETGAILVYVTHHDLPSNAQFEEINYFETYRNRRRLVALQNFYAYLVQKANFQPATSPSGSSDNQDGDGTPNM